MDKPLRRTPLYPCHEQLGAKTVAFGQWEMPISYSGVIDEHHTVRQKSGIFDVSHMGEIFVSGPDAEQFLQWLTINDLARLENGSGQYTAILNEEGGMIDDLILYRLADNSYLLCVNASNADKDFAWIAAKAKDHGQGFDVKVEDQSDDWSQLAIQGPTSEEAVKAVIPEDQQETLSQLKYMKIMPLQIGGEKAFIARTGYTGEHGYEIYLDNESVTDVWNKILATESATGIKPVGLGARDTLRLEACYLLYGNDMNETVTPLEAGISWATRLQKGDFIGKDVLVAQKEQGVPRKNVAFKLLDKGIAREGMEIYKDDQLVGKVTSGSKLPTLDIAGGMALVDTAVKIGDEVLVEVRGKKKRAEIMKKPLYSANVK